VNDSLIKTVAVFVPYKYMRETVRVLC